MNDSGGRCVITPDATIEDKMKTWRFFCLFFMGATAILCYLINTGGLGCHG